MILTCDDCGTRYVVPDTAVPPEGRQVRCKNCAHEWFVMPPPDETLVVVSDAIPDFASLVNVMPPEPAEGAIVPALITPASGLAARLAGYGTALLVILLVTGALLVERTAVITAWPPAAPAYALLGLADASSAGLSVEKLSAAATPDGLTITGRVNNQSDDIIILPGLDVVVRDGTGKPSEHWRARPPVAQLGPRVDAPLTLHYPGVAGAAATVSLRFQTE